MKRCGDDGTLAKDKNKQILKKQYLMCHLVVCPNSRHNLGLFLVLRFGASAGGLLICGQPVGFLAFEVSIILRVDRLACLYGESFMKATFCHSPCDL